MKKGKDILIELISYLDISLNELSLKCGYERPQAFYDVQNEKTKSISSKMGNAIAFAYPQIKLDWLLTGEGEMLKAAPDVVEESVPVINYERKGVPYYDVDFLCGFDLTENEQTSNADCYIDFKQYNRADFWINASGDSMRPSISPGDMLAVKQLPDVGWDAHIMYGETYAIVTEYNRTIKKIRKSTKGDAHILLVPENTTDYDEQDVQKKDIRRVFQVLGCMKSFV